MCCVSLRNLQNGRRGQDAVLGSREVNRGRGIYALDDRKQGDG